MRIIINESLLKEKKPSETYFGGREGGFPVPYDARYEVTMELQCLKWQSQRAVKVFSVNSMILKKQDHVFLIRHNDLNQWKPRD